ncbi:MAG: di-trans,poly-cis-decaprenylcistransferase [Planctomycetota bacterium]|nr:MAG: di-trans,poly-cis-decaprenylcistransferase [Planctomycetota bacterium]
MDTSPSPPRALAIIMDGNGRWAQQRGLPHIRGHEVGAESVRAITRECARLGVEELTLYAFSTENWRRSAEEVAALMDLLRRYLVEERGEIMENDIRFRAIGELDRLPTLVRKELEATRALSEGNRGMILRLALSYGSRRELLRAAQAVARLAVEQGIEAALALEEEELRRFLYDPEMLDPDLLIRTAGELRLSNFLLWQLSYSELYSTAVLWPDFREEELARAFAAYARRERRFGGRPRGG